MPSERSESGRRQMFRDARSAERFLRVSWHSDEQLVTLSLWGGAECRATFRLSTDEVPELVAVLAHGATDHDDASTEALPRTGALRVGAPPAPPALAAPAAPAVGQEPDAGQTPGSGAPGHTHDPVPRTSRQIAIRALDLLVARAADVLRARLDRLDPDRSDDQ